MKGFKKIAGRIGALLTFLLTGGGEIAREAVDDGICDLSGQGRGKYGSDAASECGGHTEE